MIEICNFSVFIYIFIHVGLASITYLGIEKDVNDWIPTTGTKKNIFIVRHYWEFLFLLSIIIQIFVLCIKQQNTHLFEKQRLGKDHRGVTKFNRSNSINDMKA